MSTNVINEIMTRLLCKCITEIEEEEIRKKPQAFLF